MKALQLAVGGARATAALRRGRLVQRRGLRPAPVQAVLEEIVTTEDERLRVAEVAAALDRRLARDFGSGSGSNGNGNGNGSAASAAATEQVVSPGDDDRTRFQLHWSVDMWQSFYPSKWVEGLDDPNTPVPDRIRQFTETLTNAVSTAGILGSSETARYWAYHLSRTGFFVVQGLAGLLASRASNGTDGPSPLLRSTRGVAGPLTEAMLMFYQDHELIKEGKYALPWDMTTSGHRQFNPLYVLQRSAAFLNEASQTLRRRGEGRNDPIWLKSGLLPDYYADGFHYQTDGWLSSRSAKVYETSTETLFVGRQDAMQRGTLVPLRDFMAGKDASQMTALEVAAGTGRFATYVKDNYPGLQLTVSDLSPFYLAEARSNMAYWKRMRAPDAQLGGVDGAGVTFLQTAAEKLDVPDNSQDIVYCVYLFHELPLSAQRAAAAEMARVVKPGGIVILTDSVQDGDRGAYQTLGNFGDFQEPFYRDYIKTPLGPMFEAAGLKCDMKLVGSSSKTLTFYKPAEDDKFAAAGTAQAAAQAAAQEVAVEGLQDE
jgi:ubiquinone/menaquinone biosynthesis C-methylase UbiE